MGMTWHSHFTVQQQYNRKQNLALLGCDTALIVSDTSNWKKKPKPEKMALPQSRKSLRTAPVLQLELHQSGADNGQPAQFGLSARDWPLALSYLAT